MLMITCKPIFLWNNKSSSEEFLFVFMVLKCFYDLEPLSVLVGKGLPGATQKRHVFEHILKCSQVHCV